MQKNKMRVPMNLLFQQRLKHVPQRDKENHGWRDGLLTKPTS
jgi:hypothetical protein